MNIDGPELPDPWWGCVSVLPGRGLRREVIILGLYTQLVTTHRAPSPVLPAFCHLHPTITWLVCRAFTNVFPGVSQLGYWRKCWVLHGGSWMAWSSHPTSKTLQAQVADAQQWAWVAGCGQVARGTLPPCHPSWLPVTAPRSTAAWPCQPSARAAVFSPGGLPVCLDGAMLPQGRLHMCFLSAAVAFRKELGAQQRGTACSRKK